MYGIGKRPAVCAIYALSRSDGAEVSDNDTSCNSNGTYKSLFPVSRFRPCTLTRKAPTSIPPHLRVIQIKYFFYNLTLGKDFRPIYLAWYFKLDISVNSDNEKTPVL